MLRLLTRHLRRLLPARPPALRQRPLAEQMEPRLLYSADLSPAGLFSGAAMPAAETRTLDAPTADWLATESTQDLSRELLIVDSGVEDADALIDELRATRPTLDVVFLDSTRDGVEQIGSILSQYSNLGAVHILSHGSAGQLLLGNSVLDAASLESRSASIADWSLALGADADILLYGCDVAAGEEGLYFIDRFARLTGADVAASTDRTGATTAGGNWVLEQRTGAIEAATLASFSWQGSLGVTAVSGDIALSSPTGGTQDNVAVAMLDNGVWLAVWESDTSLTGKGIFGRLYNADGTARGAQFTVNGTTLGDQTTPAVASDGSGGFVVSWVSNHGFDKDVYVRRFDATGNPLTGEILVTSGNFDATTGDQFTPSVAMASNGDFVVAWSGNGLADNEGVYARRFSSNGTPKAEGVLTVNTFISNKQVTPSVAMADDGRFVITWMDEGQNKRIFARTYDSSASAGSVISVQQTRYGDAKGPDVAMDASGNFVVVWAEVNIDSGHAVRMQRFGADGAFSGTPITVNTYTSNDQENPRISMNARGDLVIAWESNGQDTDSESIVMKSFLSGSVTGTEILVNGYFKDTQEIPDIALNNAGQLVVAWQGEAQAATSDDEDVSAKTYTWPESATANAAPALNTSTTLVLAAINEDAPAPVGAVGWSVTDLVSLNTSGSGPQNVSDSNSGAVTGIALTAVDATNGQWRYSTDNGVNWTLIDAATLSSTNALLLAATSQTRLHYTPNANTNGTLATAVSFRAWDRSSGSNGALADTSSNGGTTAFSTSIGSASLNVVAVNDAPTVVAIDLGNINEDSGSFTITQAMLLVGAADIEGDTLTAINLSTAPANGTLTDNLDGTWTYTPTANLNGPVSFSFGVSDGTTTTANTASLNVIAVNDAPTVVAIDLGNIDEDSGSFTITQAILLAGASDIDGDALTAINLSTAPANGALTDNLDGTWTYTPTANLNGPVSFSFGVSDGTTTTANTASLNVVAVNDTPTVVAIDLGNIDEDSGSFTITQAMLLAGASDIDGDALTAINLSTAPANGALTDNLDGTWTYTPTANLNGPVSFSFGVSDGTTTTANTASLNVVAVNDTPTVVAIDLGNIDEDSGSFTITQAMLLAGASDIDGDALTAVNLTVSGGTATGTLTAIGGGSWTYTPAANSNGSVIFAFEVSDGTTTTANTASLNVVAINDAPTVVAIDMGNINEDSGSFTITQAMLLAGASDIDGDALTAVNLTVSGGTATGTLTAIGGGSWTYTPAANSDGSVTFAFEVSDGTTTTANTASLNVVAINDAPTVVAIDLGNIDEDSGSFTITQAMLLAGAADIDGDALTAVNLTVSGGTATGTLTAIGGGSWTYTPADNSNGSVTFAFEVSDGTTTTANTAALNINAINDAPTVSTIGSQNITAGEGFGPLGFVIGDVDTSVTTLVVKAYSSNQTVVPDTAVQLSGGGTNRTLSVLAGHGGGAGTTTIVIEVDDGFITTRTSFTVNAVSPPVPAVETAPPAAPEPAPSPPAEPVVREEASRAEPTDTAAEAPVAPAAPAAQVLAEAPLPQIVLTQETNDAVASVDIVEDGAIVPVSLSLSDTDVLALLYSSPDLSATRTLESEVSRSLREARMEQAFADLRNAADQEARGERQTVAVATVTGAGLTIGYVAWIIRGGVLVSSLLTTMPAWRLLDPLPILGNSRQSDTGDDDSLESLVDGTPENPPEPVHTPEITPAAPASAQQQEARQ
ncbi:hypothetical protein CEW87_05980 [Parazoarcus communis]|uniref:Tandem-95 repeat protein n=1 Tax=Parazoarcus communis TaxID=41977 RepID=A0A2U8GZ91_9RHOO|nr:cadherin-like domain-containing protein [Parazoarcus communis]AWI78951.1 hypothetical protein CEW87_05980 [Parazoarcus communis]